MNPFILDAVVPSASMDKDSADISTEAPPASMHRPRLRLRRAVDIESRQIVDFGENSVSQIPTDDLLLDASIKL